MESAVPGEMTSKIPIHFKKKAGIVLFGDLVQHVREL